MATPPVEIEELQEFLNATEPAIEAQSRLYLSAATDLIEAKCGPLVEREVVENIYGDHSGYIMLTHYPVLTFTSITTDLDYYDVDYVDTRSELEIGRVYVGRYCHWASVEYTAGREPIPDALKLATLITAGHLWETQRGTASGALGPIFGNDEAPPGFDAAGPLSRGEVLPRRAMELIRPYIQKSFR